VKIGEDEDRAIYDLGDGIANIIILTFLLFKYADTNTVFFIEEPESSLHPGMERIFLEMITRQKHKENYPDIEHQIFLTTHSNHLLGAWLDQELAEDINIYKFSNKENEKEIESITQNKEILDILWVRNSSVFLANCVIWVEGITDRMYIRRFLEIYQKEQTRKFIEDIHYTFAEYSWANLSHFSFSEEGELNKSDKVRVEALSKRNFLVSDHDGNKNGGLYIENAIGKRLKFFSESMWKNYFDDHLTIENLIPYERFKSYFSYIRSEGLFSDAKRKVKTDIENDDFDDLNKESFDSEKTIGELLRTIFVELKEWKTLATRKKDGIDFINTRKKDASSVKVWFAKKILDHTEEKEFSWLANQAKDLCKKIYDFVWSNN